MVLFETLLDELESALGSWKQAAQEHNKHDDFIAVMPCYRVNYSNTFNIDSIKMHHTVYIKWVLWEGMLIKEKDLHWLIS